MQQLGWGAAHDHKLYPLMVSNFMQNIKNIYKVILSNIQKIDFAQLLHPLFLLFVPIGTSCKKSEKSYEPILRNAHYRHTNGRMDRRTDKGEFIGHLWLEPGDEKIIKATIFF